MKVLALRLRELPLLKADSDSNLGVRYPLIAGLFPQGTCMADFSGTRECARELPINEESGNFRKTVPRQKADRESKIRAPIS